MSPVIVVVRLGSNFCSGATKLLPHILTQALGELFQLL